MREFEYYKVTRNNDNTIPLLKEDNDCPSYLYEENPIENPKLMFFQLGDPVPRKPKIADFHFSPDSIISKKVFDVLNPLKIEGIQLLPSVIRVKKDQPITEYWTIHIYHHIKCVDAALSDCVIKSVRLAKVNKIILDKKVLETIPLKKRLIFRLKEDNSFQLFHVSIVEAIMAANPDGVRFVNIENWNKRTLFDS